MRSPASVNARTWRSLPTEFLRSPHRQHVTNTGAIACIHGAAARKHRAFGAEAGLDRTGARLKIYGLGVSQPVRAVLWACHMQGLEHELVYSLPFGNKASEPDDVRSRLDTRSEKWPNWIRTVPTIDDGGFVLSEGAAILCYLADKHAWEGLYPREPQARAQIHEYLHWHHANVRECTMGFFMPVVHPHLATPDGVERSKKTAEGAMALLEVRLATRRYLHGDTPCLSDLLCYSETGQLSFLSLFCFEAHPNLSAWMRRMESAPGYDKSHAGLSDFAPHFERLHVLSRQGNVNNNRPA